MNNPSNFFDRASILPCVVLILSVLNLCIAPPRFSAPGMYVSELGLLTVVLYFFNVKIYSPLLILWALLQLIVVKHSSLGCGLFTTADVWDPAQVIRISVYFPMVFGNGIQAGLNLVAVVLLALAVVLRPSTPMGNYLTFAAYRNNSMGIVFPIKGRAERWVNLSGEKDWLLVNMLAPYTYNNKAMCYVLIKRNDKQPLVMNQANQLVFFKPVADVNMIREENNKTDFDDEIWALCK